MNRRSVLVAVSTAQLAAGVAGQVLALQRGLAFDIALLQWKGRRDQVARDSWLIGTGVSAPVSMLATQGIATAGLAKRPSAAAARVLGMLGAAMVAGYLVERETRVALTPRTWDPMVTPVTATGVGLATAMAYLGLSGRLSREKLATERSS
jgi:hypothetical protein